MTASPASTLHDIMTCEVCSLPPQATLLEAARLMADERISSLLIMLDGTALGIITESNILRALHARQPGDVRLDAIMSTPLIMAPPHLDLLSARNLLETHGIRHLVVADIAGQMTGIVSDTDFRMHLDSAAFRSASIAAPVRRRSTRTFPVAVQSQPKKGIHSSCFLPMAMAPRGKTSP